MCVILTVSNVCSCRYQYSVCLLGAIFSVCMILTVSNVCTFSLYLTGFVCLLLLLVLFFLICFLFLISAVSIVTYKHICCGCDTHTELAGDTLMVVKH